MNVTSENESLRSCPVCDGREPVRVWEKGSLPVVRCGRCSMVYSEAVAEDLASGLFYQQRPFYLSPEKLESDYAPVRFERELRIFRTWCRTGEVLDAGCSTGGFLHQLRTRYGPAYNLLGADVATAALNYAESRELPIWRGAFLDLHLGER